MTCGYLCPQCEGKGYLEEGHPCDWCSTEIKSSVTDEDWIKSTHEGACCAGTPDDFCASS